MNWYYKDNDKTLGPLDDNAVRQLVLDGKLGRQSLVQNERTNGEWVPACQMPLLMAAFPREEDPQRKAEAERMLQQAQEKRHREKVTARLVVSAVVLVVLLAVAGAIAYRIGTPSRIRGLSPGNPIGTFEAIDRHLTRDLQMDRNQVTNCTELRRSAKAMYTYSNPKGPRGAQVAGTGSITLLVDDDRLTGILASFTSAGPRGGTIYSESLCSLWIKDTWALLYPKAPAFRLPSSQWAPGTWERSGLSDEIMKDGAITLYEGSDSRGCWYEYDKYGLKSLIFLEPRPATGE